MNKPNVPGVRPGMQPINPAKQNYTGARYVLTLHYSGLQPVLLDEFEVDIEISDSSSLEFDLAFETAQVNMSSRVTSMFAGEVPDGDESTTCWGQVQFPTSNGIDVVNLYRCFFPSFYYQIRQIFSVDDSTQAGIKDQINNAMCAGVLKMYYENRCIEHGEVILSDKYDWEVQENYMNLFDDPEVSEEFIEIAEKWLKGKKLSGLSATCARAATLKSFLDRSIKL